MLTYTVDFLARSIIDGSPGIMTGVNEHSDFNSQAVSSSNRTARSTGSPDSLRSESSSETSLSTSDIILTLDKKATIITNGLKADKPTHSYIALISMAILSSKENRMVLGDIYQFIMDKFPYYKNEDKAWRNSIRHNLSINECFIKNGRSDNGKGNLWAIHPACVEDFGKGDFRRRQARRRAKKGVKDTNSCYRTVNGFQYNPVYTPMTPAPFDYQPMTLTPLGYQPMMSPFGHQQKTSPLGHQQKTSPLGHQQRTSPLGYQQKNSPLGYQQKTSPLGYQQKTSPLGYQQKTSPLGHQQKTSALGHQQRTSPLGHQRKTSPLEYQTMTSPLGHQQKTSSLEHLQRTSPLGHQQKTSPLGHQQKTSSLGYQSETSSVPYQPMKSTQFGNFPFSPFILGYHSTPSVPHGYHPYQRPTTTKGSYAALTGDDNDKSTSPSYPSQMQLSSTDIFQYTLPNILNTTGDALSKTQFNL